MIPDEPLDPPRTPDGRILGPDLGITPAALNDPVNAWAVEAGAMVAAGAYVIPGHHGPLCPDIAYLGAHMGRQLIEQNACTLGPAGVQLHYENAPELDDVLAGLELGRVSGAIDVDLLRRRLDEYGEATLVLLHIAVMPNSRTDHLAPAIDAPRPDLRHPGPAVYRLDLAADAVPGWLEVALRFAAVNAVGDPERPDLPIALEVGQLAELTVPNELLERDRIADAELGARLAASGPGLTVSAWADHATERTLYQLTRPA